LAKSQLKTEMPLDLFYWERLFSEFFSIITILVLE